MSTAFSITRDQIISSALRKLQVLELGATPDDDTVTNASQSLNLLMKAWQTQGIKLWTVQEYAVTLVENQNLYKIGQTRVKTGTVTITNADPAVVTYTNSGLTLTTPVVFTTTGALPTGLTAGSTYYVVSTPTASTFTVSSTVGGAAIATSSAGSGVHTCTITTPVTVDSNTDKPLKVIQGWLRNTSVTPNIDIPVQLLSRQEYNLLGSKSATGQVNSIWYDPRETHGELHVYLTPNATVAANYTLYVVGQKPIGDILLSTDIPNFPTEWMQALVWGLADELAIEYGSHVNLRQEIMMKAEKYKNDLTDWDVENTSTYFQVDTRMSR